MQLPLTDADTLFEELLQDQHWFSMMGTVLPFEIITYAI